MNLCSTSNAGKSTMTQQTNPPTKELLKRRRIIVRNSDFRFLTNNLEKGNKNGLRKLEGKEGDEIATMHNKE